MSKYIINIPDGFEWGVVTCRTDDGFYTRDFDSLEELNSDYINEHFGSLQDDAYQRGLEDAWECAKKLFSTMSDTEIEKVFPVEWKSGFSGLMQMKPQYAIEMLKAHEKKQRADDKIKVGDEVVWTEDENVVIVVTSVYTADDMEWCNGVCKNGKVYSILMKNARKTGRHFDIDKILEDMRHD